VPPIPAEPVAVNIVGGRFVPHGLGVRAGQPVAITNGDPMTQNFHSMPLRSDAANRVLKPGEIINVIYNKSERFPVRATCDFYPGMQTYHLALDHPWFAVTNAEGAFEIDDLPAGRHEFLVWHERVGYLEKPYLVTIAAGKVTEMAETYPADHFSVAVQGAPRANRTLWIGPFDLTRRGAGDDVTIGRRLLRFRLEKRIRAVDRLIMLTEEQRQKLELAGNSDIEHLFDRINQLRDKFATTRGTPMEVEQLIGREAAPLRTAFNSGPFAEGSLFAKVLKLTLTPEQATRYDEGRATVPALRP
jgi:hypothetical protein